MTNSLYQFDLIHDQTELYIAKLSNVVELPSNSAHLCSLTILPDEVSLVAPASFISAINDKNILEKNGPWQAIKINQTLAFNMVGVLTQLSQALAERSISIFVVSTFNTDCILVQSEMIEKTLMQLRQQGHHITTHTFNQPKRDAF